MSAFFPELRWTADELGAGVDRLRGVSETAAYAGGGQRSSDIATALEAALAADNLEAVPLSCSADQIGRCLANSAPMVVQLAGSDEALLVAQAGRRSAVLIGRDGSRRSLPMAELAAALTPPLPEEVATTISRLNQEVSSDVAAAVSAEQRRQQRVFVGWQLPQEEEQTLWNRANFARILGLLSVHALQFSLWVTSWVTLVAALLSVGERDALLSVWIVTLISALLLLPLESLLQQSLAVRLGIDIKQSLLKNALGLDKAAVRAQGIGQLIARALEANRLDVLATQGGLRVLLSAFDALAIIAVFMWFAGLHPLLMLFLLTVLLAVRWWTMYHAAEERLHAAHLRLTAVHTEEMIGHRTRKVFLGREQWHAEEEACLLAYERACAQADRAELGIGAVPRIWAVCGVAVILLDLFAQGGSTLTSVALIGFVIVGFGILHGACSGIMKLLKALVSSRYVNALETAPPAPSAAANHRVEADGGSHLVVRGLEYVYPDSSRQVLRDVSLELGESDKVLMTGGSGSGKSTLGAILAGRLQPNAGTVLSQGIDRYVAGAKGWLKQVCYVPQPGSNHVLTETFAFNLLLGRAWPPTARDLQEAQQVAERLGLGPLIEKMPAGMMQMVGEGGWRLSQGEQARLFLARGILQDARLLVVDELLAPLDPETGLEVLKTVEDLPSQLLLIAHT